MGVVVNLESGTGRSPSLEALSTLTSSDLKEVNDLIRSHHPDCAPIRQKFIANKLMAREKGVYWQK